MKSNVQKHFKTKSKLRAYNQGGAVACPNCGKYHNGGACYMADGGDIISRGNQRIDDAIEAMSRGDAAPAPASAPDMSETLQAHPVNPSFAGGFPTDKTPVLDRAFETMIKLGLRAGGPVRGPGGPKEDKIPAMLSNGEYVLPADTVQAVGKQNLDTLRAKTHKFADGGGASYTGDVFQQFNQALGDQPRTLQSNPGSERLHSLFDASLGFRDTPSSALDTYSRTFQYADGGTVPYPKMWAGQYPCPEDETAYPRDPAGSSRLRFMRDGGGIPYPEQWTGDPRVRFLANGGFPDASGLEVEEIPTQTLGGSPERLDARFTGAQVGQPYPGPEGIEVTGHYQNGRPGSAPATGEADLPGYRTGDAEAPFRQTATPMNPGAVADEAEAAAKPGLRARVLGGARNLVGKVAGAAEPIIGAYGAYEGAVASPEEGARSLGVETPTTNRDIATNRISNAITHGVSALTMGALSPEDLSYASGAYKPGAEGYLPPRDQQGWGAGIINDILGNNDKVQPVGFAGNKIGATAQDVQNTGGGGLRARTDTAAPPPGGGTPQGTAIINGRTVSPQEIAALNQRNVIPAGTSPFPDSSLQQAGPGQATASTDRSDQGGVFHMPQRDFAGEANAGIDNAEKKIGPIGRSAARLRAYAGLEGQRAGLNPEFAGQGSRERVADKELQATIAQRTWDRNLDYAKFGIEQGRLNRQMAHDQATLGLEQAKYLDNRRGDIMTNQIPNILKGLPGFKVDDKGNLDTASQQKASDVIRRLQASVPDLARIPQEHLPMLAKLALDSKNADEAQRGIGGYLRRFALGDTSGGATSDVIGNATPVGRNRGAFIDTYEDPLHRRTPVNSALRGTILPLGPVDADKAKFYGQ